MPPSLPERIREDMVAAMKARDKDRVSVLRMLVSVLKDEAIKKRGDLDDSESLAVVMSYAKKREQTLEEMVKAGREDLAAKERHELAVVGTYLPEQLGEEELTRLVQEIIDELGAATMKDMGRVMKACQERIAGRAPGSRISAVVKARLSG